jgi:hypothetical protein
VWLCAPMSACSESQRFGGQKRASGVVICSSVFNLERAQRRRGDATQAGGVVVPVVSLLVMCCVCSVAGSGGASLAASGWRRSACQVQSRSSLVPRSEPVSHFRSQRRGSSREEGADSQQAGGRRGALGGPGGRLSWRVPSERARRARRGWTGSSRQASAVARWRGTRSTGCDAMRDGLSSCVGHGSGAAKSHKRITGPWCRSCLSLPPSAAGLVGPPPCPPYGVCLTFWATDWSEPLDCRIEHGRSRRPAVQLATSGSRSARVRGLAALERNGL